MMGIMLCVLLGVLAAAACVALLTAGPNELRGW